MVDTPRGRNLRPPPRTVEVVTVERIAPRLVAITFGGDALRGFPEPPPTSHIKIFLPDAEGRLTLPVAGPDGLVWPNGRPPMRTYTPRRYDAAANTLRVDFVLHGDGVAAQWAERCVPGDRAAIGGPGGRFVMDSRVMRWWVGGDESAIPAIATLIEALPTTAEVHLEVDGPADHVGLPDQSGVDITWHHRAGTDSSRWGGELVAAAHARAIDPVGHDWVGCEASAARRIRAHLLAERSLSRTQVTTRGYWRLGEANHPDHDYGED